MCGIISENKHARGNFCGVLSGGFGYYNSQEHFDKKDRGNYVIGILVMN